ncbi:zinc-ribbon domain-containing protein [Candidatus Cryosericum hinesii]|uniref:Zinc-ribbon domain-containing protein n=3 Tax=Candidatus Cryosericaceae TaxID=2498708 RepID=A0A398DES5_9BACT|nr:zinc-ribbon domain-containing protein [Candidatus Cryosericum hinesii]RIE10345.1 zinc-ribbon domain-containing protein [Candidatus Cryosericum odellii]RIE12983.1 zinc-ribbon domain-containing protein [Candidatus Cryosericum hinesii]RIE13222.1 zinc-ribbon domain-containing protein [Candidatus Cryosericum hinesii]
METAKFCTQCGETLPSGAKHCPHCGAEVTVVQTPVPGEVERPVPPSPPVPQQTPSAGPYGTPSSPQTSPYGGSGTVPQGTYSVPPPAAGVYRAGSQQKAMTAQRAPSRKRLGGGALTLIAGIIMLAMHALVLEGGLTASNIGVDLSIIVCGFLMLFARGGLSVALAFVASLAVSAVDAMLLWAVFVAISAGGSSGIAAFLSSGAWVSVVAMVVVLVGFLVALVSLFRHS